MQLRIHSILIAIVGLLFTCGVSGCQLTYPFEISGVITSATDGMPLAGVCVTIKGDGLLGDLPFPIITGPDGTFSANFRVGFGEFGG